MDTGKAIFFGLALIALAIFATDAMRPANAGADEVGRYMGSARADRATLWIVDTANGRYRKCDVDSCQAWYDGS